MTRGRDEIGIIVAARGDDGDAYVLADRSLRDAPAVWGRAAVRAYHDFGADRIIAEENFGGEMVRFVIRAADANVGVRVISASRGKVQRAEPISALYEQGLVHHVGRFAELEDQLCAFTTQGYRGEGSPDRADALVWALTELMLGETQGWGLFEHYHRAAEGKAGAVTAKSSPVAPSSAPAPRHNDNVTLKAPPNISTVHGRYGDLYLVDADGSVEVAPHDAKALFKHGFAAADDAEAK
jgi:hypothetical protein